MIQQLSDGSFVKIPSTTFDPVVEQASIVSDRANVDLRKSQALDSLNAQFQSEYDALDERQAALDSASSEIPAIQAMLKPAGPAIKA